MYQYTVQLARRLGLGDLDTEKLLYGTVCYSNLSIACTCVNKFDWMLEPCLCVRDNAVYLCRATYVPRIDKNLPKVDLLPIDDNSVAYCIDLLANSEVVSC